MKSVMRGATLASQLLSFARKQPLAPVVINLKRLFADMTEILWSAVGEGIEIETSVSDDLWNTNVDPNSLENAILNLTINARDAMDRQGKLTIHVVNAELDRVQARRHAGLAPGQYVAVSLTDTGSGIAPEVMDRIFEPFFTTKEDGKGTGLGLSMVYGFAKQSGGHVTIDSTVGHGTKITLYLPRSLEAEHIAPSTAHTARMGGSETILLVEDDDDVRETAHSALADLGYTVLQAADPDAAIVILKGDTPVDLLFTDVVMPGQLGGQHLAKRAKSLRPGLPVLFTSGYVQDAMVHEGRLDSGVQLLGKPYTQLALTQKIREILGHEGHQVQKHTIAAQVTDEPKRGHADFAGLRVLLCEDDVFIRLDFAQGLRDNGCDVTEAGTAQEALDMLRANQVDILITDIGLPDNSGEVLATQVREFMPDLPVIFATGGVEVSAAAQLGNCRVITKPFRDADLLAAIEKLLPVQA